MVLVRVEDSEWFGFVNIRWLREKVETGEDNVIARVVNVEGPEFSALIPGNAPNSGLIERRVDHAVHCDSVET